MHNITTGTVELGCDREEAFKVATQHLFQPSTCMSHYNLTLKLHYLINNSPITWEFRHVKGNQDKLKSVDELDEWERLNVYADSLTKWQLHQDS